MVKLPYRNRSLGCKSIKHSSNCVLMGHRGTTQCTTKRVVDGLR